MGSSQSRCEQAVQLCPILLPKLDFIVSNRALSFYHLLKPLPILRMNIYLSNVRLHQFFSGIAKEIQRRLVDINEFAVSGGYIDCVS